MKKNSISGFELNQVNLETINGGKVVETTMTNGNCDEVTLCGLFRNKVDSIYEQPAGF
jgi:hypothetical protein